MKTHTPAPWEYDGKFTVGIPHANGQTYFRTNPEDARLIAAAPDLLTALQDITEHLAGVMSGPLIAGQGIQFENGVEDIPTIAAARAAIAKATKP